jgi:hypothetical protein
MHAHIMSAYILQMFHTMVPKKITQFLENYYFCNMLLMTTSTKTSLGMHSLTKLLRTVTNLGLISYVLRPVCIVQRAQGLL